MVDDDPDDQEIVGDLLAEAGFNPDAVLRAFTGKEGLALCRSGGVDCLLLDYRLPDINGMEFLEILSRDEGRVPMPVIFLTGMRDQDLAVNAMRRGASDYLAKDELSAELLAGSIRNVMEKRQAVRELEDYRLRLETMVLERTDSLRVANEQLRREMEERRRAESVMRVQRDLGLALNDAETLSQGLDLCLEAAITASGMDAGGIYRLDRKSGTLNLIFHKGISAPFVESVSHYPMDVPAARMVMSGKPFFGVYHRLGLPLGAVEKREGLKAMAVLPLIRGERVIGSLNMASHALDHIPEFSRVIMEAMASQIVSEMVHLEDREALAREKEKFQALVEESSLGISLIGKDGRYIYVNPTFVRMLGYTLGDIPTGRAWFQKAYPDAGRRKEAMVAWVRDRETAQPGDARPRTFPVVCGDGAKKVIQFIPMTLQNGDQLMLYEDLTREKKLEAQLHQAQKMEAVGNLAGGMAHDFRNLLTPILGYAQMSLMKLPGNDPLREYLLEIKHAGESASALTEGLLAFSRKQALKPEILELNGVVERLSKILERTLREDVMLVKVLSPEPGRVKMDPVRMEKVAGLVLEQSGQRVLEAGEGEAALRICEAHAEEIHLLITDVIMPGMNGREVADRVRALRPEIKVLFMSGYTDNVIAHHGILDADVNFLEKPFSPEMLLDRVREVLGSSKGD